MSQSKPILSTSLKAGSLVQVPHTHVLAWNPRERHFLPISVNSAITYLNGDICSTDVEGSLGDSRRLSANGAIWQ